MWIIYIVIWIPQVTSPLRSEMHPTKLPPSQQLDLCYHTAAKVVKTFLSLSYNQSLSLSSSLSLSLSSSPSLSLSLCLSFHRLCLPPSLQLDRRYQTAAGRLKASGSLSGQKIHNYAELGTLFAQVCNSGCEHLTTFAAHYSSFTTLHNYAHLCTSAHCAKAGALFKSRKISNGLSCRWNCSHARIMQPVVFLKMEI